MALWRPLQLVLGTAVAGALLTVAVFFVLGILAVREGNPALLVRACLGGGGAVLGAWLLGKGYQLARNRANDLAIAGHAAAIQHDPPDPVGHANRGTSCMAGREYTRAIAHFDRAIHLAPAQPFAYVGRVNAHAAIGRVDRVIAEYSEVLRRDPQNALAYCARATAYNTLGRFDLTIPDAAEAIRLAPHLYLGYDARGYALWQRGNFRGLMRLVALAWMLLSLGILRRDHLSWKTPAGTRADLEQALADFSEAIQLEPRAWDCYHGRAMVYRALGDQASASVDEAWSRELQGR